MLQNARKRLLEALRASQPRSPATGAQATSRRLKCYRMQGKGHWGAPGVQRAPKSGFRSPGHQQEA